MADIIFTGNLGADSEMRYTPNGGPVLTFRVAEQWFRVEIWGSTAEFLAEHLKSGVRVKVYGQFYKRDYEGKNGAGVSLDVKASAVEILTSYKDRQKLANDVPAAQEDPWATAQSSEVPF